MQKKIEAALDQCLVTKKEWNKMIKNNFTQKISDDPFELHEDDDDGEN